MTTEAVALPAPAAVDMNSPRLQSPVKDVFRCLNPKFSWKARHAAKDFAILVTSDSGLVNDEAIKTQDSAKQPVNSVAASPPPTNSAVNIPPARDSAKRPRSVGSQLTAPPPGDEDKDQVFPQRPPKKPRGKQAASGVKSRSASVSSESQGNTSSEDNTGNHKAISSSRCSTEAVPVPSVPSPLRRGAPSSGSIAGDDRGVITAGGEKKADVTEKASEGIEVKPAVQTEAEQTKNEGMDGAEGMDG
eukprot:CAMPEP_0197847160 /NCGR_PEP_ID=MMETSP1438-20131217/5342_1 /TAXON_ID=1461541 /ORGANISM="Pterosperma sp., Strain CCMP1384" /LENGTH=245 /DNA_ID=CAMNT_0043459005 /DNA_START=102 /DNA_END=836 /DNA_ORIENTATION=-